MSELSWGKLWLSHCDSKSGTFQRRPPRLLPNFKSARVGELSRDNVTGALQLTYPEDFEYTVGLYSIGSHGYRSLTLRILSTQSAFV